MGRKVLSLSVPDDLPRKPGLRSRKGKRRSWSRKLATVESRESMSLPDLLNPIIFSRSPSDRTPASVQTVTPTPGALSSQQGRARCLGFWLSLCPDGWVRDRSTDAGGRFKSQVSRGAEGWRDGGSKVVMEHIASKKRKKRNSV